MNFTHEGWFILCPVYIAEIDTDNPILLAKCKWLNWWFTLQTLFFKVKKEIVLKKVKTIKEPFRLDAEYEQY